MENFDPNEIGVANGNYFGLPFKPEDAKLVLISVPWDVTTSYSPGTADGPDAILDASLQCDLYDFHNPSGWEEGIGTIEIDQKILETSKHLRNDAERVIGHLETGGSIDDEYAKKKIAKINEASTKLNEYVYNSSQEWLGRDKIVGVVGGDHSVPLGLIRAVAEHEGVIGVLHIDAHADLRNAYEGFKYSHASIMYNVLQEVPKVEKLVQVGIRDTCDAEVSLSRTDERIESFSDYRLKELEFEGQSWKKTCETIVNNLPKKVYISFDIDGLSPDNCPNTGTPVPGGLSFHQAVYLINSVAESGRQIVGFDLTEVSPADNDQWDANVGARILYKLCNITLKSNSQK